MAQRKIYVLAALIVSVGLAWSFQNTPDHKVLFEKAKFAMESKGDLQGAIKIFQEIILKYPQEKVYAARAQFYIGACYEKLGNTEAIKAYELILKKYPEQAELVGAARERLAALRQEKPAVGETEILRPAEGIFDAHSLSPDGTKVAVVDYSIGENIAVYDLATKRLDLITRYDYRQSEDSAWTYRPLWSPEGKELAHVFAAYFKKPQARELRVTSLDGKSRTLYRVEGEDDVSPLGWLKVGSAVSAAVTKSKTATLGLISSSGEDFKPLRAVMKAGNADSSPDGRWIVFDDLAEGKSHDIFVISRDGKVVSALTDHPSDDKAPRWSPDGKHVVFLSERHGDWALWGVAVSEGRPAGEPFMIKAGMQDAALLNWIPSGLGIQFTIRMNDVYVMPVNPATGEPAGKAEALSYPVTGINWSPVWSPDGKSLAFISFNRRQPERTKIVVLPAEGGEGREFLISSKNSMFTFFDNLRWLPDSSGLGFLGYSGNDKTWSLFRLHLETGERGAWPVQGAWPGAQWTGSDTYIYCQPGQYSEESTIVERHLDGGTDRIIYKSEKPSSGTIEFRQLKFSRDRKWLGFLEFCKDGTKLVVVDLESGKSRILSSETFGGPAWSPDGNLVLALGGSAEEENSRLIGIFSLRDGTVKKYPIANWFPRNAMVFGPDWSLDGKHVVFRVGSVRSELLRMKNVIPEQR